ncbi:lasso peptide biosynthesis B2 protein [Clostridium beijerinckii]|uniref:lasso peptide biosynthesis B2 protein n=1 Tax=Clostridium beijerinckii TaxID=1520 RepID=UPI00068750E0|nr:lasso peptide biosynthesis B2 protein [Clostridium beijerinckii]
MRNLLQLNKRTITFNMLKTFSRLKLKDKVLIVRVFALTAIARSAILFIPFKKLRKYIGKINEESSFNLSDEEYKIARKISWSISKVAKYTPWESKCLVQALTAQYLLSHSHIESTLYLGVSKENYINIENKKDNSDKDVGKSNLVAHSWIRCGSYYVTGGNGTGFKVVAKFTRYEK